MIPSTKSQRQLIGIACTQLGIDKGLKADMLLERFGKTSTCDIDKMQADAFLKELRSRGWRIKRKKAARSPVKRAAANTIAMVSRAEREKVAAVSALIRWRVEGGLALWMQKRLGIDKIRTGNDAYRVIEGLKKMFENGMKKQYGPDWWVKSYNDPGIETYIREHCPLEYRDLMQLARARAGLIRPLYRSSK